MQLFKPFAIMPRCWLGQMTEYIRIDWFCSNFAARDVLYTFGPLFPKVIIDSKRDFNSEEELLEEGCKISACYVACLCQPHCFFVAAKPTNQVNWHHGQGLFPFQCMVVQILPTLFSTTSRLWIILDSSAVSIFVDVFIELTVFVFRPTYTYKYWDGSAVEIMQADGRIGRISANEWICRLYEWGKSKDDLDERIGRSR